MFGWGIKWWWFLIRFFALLGIIRKFSISCGPLTIPYVIFGSLIQINASSMYRRKFNSISRKKKIPKKINEGGDDCDYFFLSSIQRMTYNMTCIGCWFELVKWYRNSSNISICLHASVTCRLTWRRKIIDFCAELRWNFFVCQLKSWMMEIAFHATTTRRLSHYINAMLKFIESKMNLDTFRCVRHCCHADINVRPSK